MSLSSADILKAAHRVERSFPFERYISTGAKQAMIHIIKELQSHGATTGRLLDIGCGPMDKTAILSAVGYTCFGADDLGDPWHGRDGNRERILEFARQHGIQFHLQAAGDYSIPFAAGSFDIVTTFEVIEHLHESPRELLNTAGSFLRDDGLLCVTMPNAVNLRKRVAVALGRTNYPPVAQFFHSSARWRGHVREYTLDEAVFICREAGFEVLSATTFEGYAHDKLKGPALRLFLQLTRLAPTLRSGLCVVARKPPGWERRSADDAAFAAALPAAAPPAVR